MGTISISLTSSGQSFRVQRMLLHNELNRLPVLLAKIAVEAGEYPPALGKAYTLGMTLSGNAEENPFGIDQWLVQSFFRLPAPAGTATNFGYLVQLTAVPGQMLPMKAYATDSGGNFNAIINDFCSRIGKVQIGSSGSSAEEIKLDTVVSLGETLEQFLRRMALGSNQWFCAGKNKAVAAALDLIWQGPQQYSKEAPVDIGDSIWVAGMLAAPQQVWEYWPRALNKAGAAAAPPPKKEDFCIEQISALPLNTDESAKASAAVDGGACKLGFILGDKPELAPAWPGRSIANANAGETTVAWSVLHLFNEDNADGGIGRILRQGIPGLTDGEADSALDPQGQYGVLVIAGAGGASYLDSRALLDRFGARPVARAAATALGLMPDGAFLLPDDDSGQAGSNAPQTMLATVVPWDSAQSITWAAGGRADQQPGHTTEIKVRFDWCETPIRVPYAYAMDGSDGLVFFPPSAGDRVLVLLDRLWPIVALNAWEYNNVGFPPEFQRAATGDSLSAPRGAMVRGGLLFKTLNVEGPNTEANSSGDVVIHAAGDLILRAEGNLILDGKHLWDYGRPKT